MSVHVHDAEGLTIGVDVGGTKIAAGVISPSGDVLLRATRATDPTDPDQIERSVAEVVLELVTDYPQVAAVGVAAAGFVSPDQSTVVFAPNIAWRNHPLGARLADLIALPVVVENDANAAAWAEYRFGRGRGSSSMLMLTVGTGLGGGLVVNGDLVRGAFGAAGELGHVNVLPGGHYCGCGQEGCWEAYASGTALAKRARAVATSDAPGAAAMLRFANGAALSGAHVTAAAREGDACALGLLTDLGDRLGAGIATVCAVVDPQVVVVGGGIAAVAGDLILPAARDGFLRRLPGRGFRDAPSIVPAALANEAGIVGAGDSARAAVRSRVDVAASA